MLVCFTSAMRSPPQQHDRNGSICDATAAPCRKARETAAAPLAMGIAPAVGHADRDRRRAAAPLSAGSALSRGQPGLHPYALALGKWSAGRAGIRPHREHGAELADDGDRGRGWTLLSPPRDRLAGASRSPR